MRSIFIIPAILVIGCNFNQPTFMKLSPEKTGITFTNTILETDSFNILITEYLYNGGGVGIGDLNNDGFQDIIFSGNHMDSKVYLNNGNFTFHDISDHFDGLTNDQWFSGIAIADINGDGWQDVYMTATMNKNSDKRKNRLWINQGSSGTKAPLFKEEGGEYGIADTGYSVTAGFLDYDKDGDLDLYVLNNIVTKNVPAKYRIKITDGSSDNNDQLYRNDGHGHFDNVTKEAGIVFEGYGLGLAIGDVNKDGYPDIYVSNDYISNDLLYINQRNGTFQNMSPQYLSYQSKSSMGDDMADVNNDGYPDIFTLDMFPGNYARKKQTINGNSYVFYNHDKEFGYEHQYIRNMLQMNNGVLNGKLLPFSEEGQMAGIFQTEWSWSALFADYDNDGDKDLIITNGFPKDATDKDWTNYKAKYYGYLASAKNVISKMPTLYISNYAFENQGGLKFKDVTKKWGLDIPSFSNGAAFVDLDNDGDLDYVTNNLNEEAFVFQNLTSDKRAGRVNYIRIKLEGNEENLNAIGAKVHVWTGTTHQFQENFTSRGFISCVDPILHFGVGKATTIDSILVIWPDTDRSILLKNVHVNQKIVISELESNKQDFQWTKSSKRPLLFERCDSILEHVHAQKDYIDFFQNQTILPHKYSQIGPVMTTGDLNGDGKEDLLIGATNEQPTTVFLRKDHGFLETQIEGLTKEKLCPESAIAIVDIDNDGDNDVVAASGGYKNKPDEYVHRLYINEGGTFKEERLDMPPFPASVIKPFDFDHDGDMDLLIGARVDKGRFPFAPYSWLLINDKGKFKKSAAIPLDMGMVTDAVWSDIDGDGWEDLLLAREWNSVIILKNTEGKGLVVHKDDQLNELHGFWSGIIAADFDGDGDDDYLLGNLGLNHRFNVSEEYPMHLYAVDLEKDGNIDPISTAFWKNDEGKMTEYPINYLDELGSQSSFVRKKFNSYTKFSHATIADFLDPAKVPETNRFYVNATSSYVAWNQSGKLTLEALPRAVQIAPLTKFIVSDLNGDQYPDIIALGNDHTYDVSTGFYDANKGLVLISKGPTQDFSVLLSRETGLVVNGQVGSAVQIKTTSNLIIIGINRGKTLVYQLNTPVP